jgi:probable F420-dependent oxidoreductase
VQLGVVFPQLEIGTDPEGLRQYARAVAEMGYRHLVAYDHVVGADPAAHPGWSGPYDIDSTFHEPFTLFSYLAAVAPELELATAVIILPQRQTVLVAKQAAQVDILTRGRFRLGVGIGWNPVEYEALGMNFGDRGRRFEEQIELMRLLWTRRRVDFQGRWHRVTGAGINPLPVQRPIPVWFGANSEPALRRAARMGQGLFTLRPLPEGWPATLQRLRQWREEAGLDPAQFAIEARLNVAEHPPDYWRRKADEWRALGAAYLQINTMRCGLQGPQAHIDMLARVMKALS